MKKYVLIFGLIIGTILCVNMLYTVNQLYNNSNFTGNEIIGYAAIVIVFSLIFFGVRNYRNKHLNGFISFGKAFKTGFLIALLGSTLYVSAWLFYYYLFIPDYLDIYIPFALGEVPSTELAAKTTEMESFKEMYKNPLFVVLITFFEVLPIGILVSFLSALFLKKKNRS